MSRQVNPSWFDVTTRWQMVGTVLRWNPAMIPPHLVGCKSVTRSHRMTFFKDETAWRALRSKDLRVDRLLLHIGRTSFKQYAVVTRNGVPVCSLTTTVVAIDDSLRHSIPLPLAETMHAAMAAQEPKTKRLLALPWPSWAAPGAGSEHEEKMARSSRPADAFCLRTVARWVETDEFGHLSQSQYALLMEEARAAAAASGGFGSRECCAAAGGTPVSFQIDFVGQARPGDALRIFVWLDSLLRLGPPGDGGCVCCEIEKEGREGHKSELLTVSRVWVASKKVDQDQYRDQDQRNASYAVHETPHAKL